jgi:D-alanyl-D-alanine carboxypeptidase
VGGTVEGFVAIMNRAAARLGMSRTAFASPNGLDDSGYSTARDLARLTRAVERLPAFGTIVATRVHEVPSPIGEPRVIQNLNALLWLYPGATGVKTGFTSAAICILPRPSARTSPGGRAGERGEAFSDAALLSYGSRRSSGGR